jgi:hypothetical protein
LHEVPDTDQQLPARKGSQPIKLASNTAVCEVHPANDAGHELVLLR